ncbi:MAG: carbohydrate ABC transporter permease [Clostridium sp.]|uniref:Inner membrane ABC transporter permease protein YcjP n=1 Tax=Clostridium paraputrificum TaxID=29363 RepID=A0A6N3CU44_9CLOT|nr:carbohydrate ABC transporter permease [Clostridium sp.]MBS5926416.1 carbohydrate ABC transporter permease [Clostridium sp.]MBS5987550.1 carbohydrate ABC transporter permease [Clostridium sp.]
MIESKGTKIFYVVNYIILTILAIVVILPFMHLISKSFSSNSAVISGQVGFFPVDFTTSAYEFVILNKEFFTSFAVSVFVTLVGTILSVGITVLTAYPLSKPNFIGRKFFLKIFVITMLFGGTMISSFLLIKGLGMYNTIWALIIPGILAPYNMLLIKNFLEGIPEALEEAASIDGANSMQILIKIIAPLMLPSIATIGLFYAVSYWNSYFNGIMYVTDAELKPLQTYLYEVLRLSTLPAHELPAELADKVSTGAVQSATVMASTIPILVVYPFLQKYFVKGLVVGSVKG